jgi:hypothetical protein
VIVFLRWVPRSGAAVLRPYREHAEGKAAKVATVTSVQGGIP